MIASAVTATAAVRNRVQGNLIGTDVTGTEKVPNQRHGVIISSPILEPTAFASDNTIGGDQDGEGNFISGNLLDGVQIVFGATNDAVVNLVTKAFGG